MPFRTAYKLTGALVRRCADQGIPLSHAPLDLARQIDPRFTPEVLRAADAAASVARKKNAGGTGRASLDAQIASLRASAKAAASASSAVPRLDRLLAELKESGL